MPHSRQIGITGRSVSLGSIRPRCRKFNHTVGFRGAALSWRSTVTGAPIFERVRPRLVGDWREIVPLAQRALDARRMAGWQLL